MILTLLFLGSIQTHAQNNLSFYYLGDYVQQTTSVSPVYIPKNSFSLGLPVLSGIYASVSSDLPSNLILTPDPNDPEKNDINLQNIIDLTTGDLLNIKLNQSFSLLHLSFKRKNGSLSFFANEIIDANIGFSKNGIFNLLNGGSTQVGNQLLFNDKVNITAYSEAGFGFTQQFLDKKLAIGLRAKYILGILNGSTFDDGEISIDIEDDFTWRVNTRNAGFRVAGLQFDEDYTFSSDHKGFGFDIGATYEVIPNLTLELAINDLGSITWKNSTTTYRLKDVTDVRIEGVDLTSDGDLAEEFVDQLEAAADGEENKGESYTTTLNTNSYVSALYKLKNIHHFKLTMFNQHQNSDNQSVIALGYNLALKKSTYGLVGIKDEVGEISMGLNFAATLGGLQIYATSDNLFTGLTKLESPELLTNINARIGINFVFGYKKWILKKAKEEEEFDEEEIEVEIIQQEVEEVVEDEVGQTDQNLQSIE